MRDSQQDQAENALAQARSPYLLQHKLNPVQWVQWSEEAFATAQSLDRPVLISIGYATCHWCHVMAHESFEDKEVADFLNAHFVCIKVDREERPDIDAIYMDVCQSMTGHGGWPLTIVTDADKRPFFAGTYFPRRTIGNRLGFLELMTRIAEVWQTERSRLTQASADITRSLQEQASADMRGNIPANVFDVVADYHRQTFDKVFGGFNAQPKFPSPHHLLLLMRIAARQGAADVLAMVVTTLDGMRSGGIYDHIGFGFHRYSTDREWLVPHFEKMLYDQAMLMMAYTEAWQITADGAYRTVVEELAEYVSRALTTTDGAFMSAQDADSEGIEGKAYVWSHKEFTAIAGIDAANAFHVTSEGNFHDEASGAKTALNIPHLKQQELRKNVADTTWSTSRTALLAVRERRIQPITDTKVLADWNGLMIGALARAARALHSDGLLRMARRAYHAVAAELGSTRSLRHTHGVASMLDDHAAIGWAAIELFQSTGDEAFLVDAVDHATIIRERFADGNGVLYTVAQETKDVIVRQKQGYDGAYPSGNSMAAWLFSTLGNILNDQTLRTAAVNCVRAWGTQIQRQGPGFCMLLSAWDTIEQGSQEIVLNGPRDDVFLNAAKKSIGASFLPDTVIVHPGASLLEGALYPTASAPVPSILWCAQRVCQRPMTTLEEVDEHLRSIRWGRPPK